MKRRNFLQILNEQGINLRREYDRLYDLFYNQKVPSNLGNNYTLKDYVEINFLSVPFRKTCLSLDDFNSIDSILSKTHMDLI